MNTAFLLVSDDNYIMGLQAQINSIYRYYKEPKIYVVHNLSKKNLKVIEPFVYKVEKIDHSKWTHIQEEHYKGHVNNTSLGKFQVEFIEEDNFFYLDTDVILTKKLNNKFTTTMDIDIKEHYLLDQPKLDKKYNSLYVFATNKKITGDRYKIFSDGFFRGNKKWISKKLIPLMIDISKEILTLKTEQPWFEMGFFNAAILRHNLQVQKIEMKQAYPAMHSKDWKKQIDYASLNECHAIHYMSPCKPFFYKKGSYPMLYEKEWWDCFELGPVIGVKPLMKSEQIIQNKQTNS